MPAVSKAQQRFMGMVHAVKQGETPASDNVAKAAASMSDKSAKDFASTSTKGLPDKIKEIILSELRSVRVIQNEYSKVLDTIQQTLQTYKTTSDDTQRKKLVDTLKRLGDTKKRLAKELDDTVSGLYKDAELKVVDEANTTANVQGYATPGAFAKPGSDEKEKGRHQASLTGYTLAESVLDPKAAKFLDTIQVIDRGIKDLSNITVDATPQGNWSVYYKGRRIGTVNGKLLDDKTIMKYGLEESNKPLKEMAEHDVNVEKILRMYDKGGNFTKKKVAAVVCANPNASREKVLKALLHAEHRDTVEFAHKLGV